MIKVKLTTHNYHSSIKNDFLEHTPKNSGIWEDVHFLVNEPVEECDYWVVIDCVPEKESTMCPKDNILFITGEPTSIKKYSQKFLNQFPKIITTQPGIQGPGVHHMPVGMQWWPKKTFDELYGHNEVKKDKLISIAVSGKAYTPGHKKRLEFCLKLKSYLGDRADFFGGHGAPYKKLDVLDSYKYSIAIENSREHDYISEKLTDCFVCMTFPFYYGCPNVDEYYNKNSYEFLDIDNFEKACHTIERVLSDPDHYSRNLENLIQAKNEYMTKRMTQPLVANFIKKEYGNGVSKPKERVVLRPEKDFQKVKEATQNIKKFLIRVKNKIKL